MKKILLTLLGGVILLLGLFAGYVFYTNRPLAQNENDLPILERALVLLADEAHWSQEDDRSCPPGETRLSLYCALRQASRDITGEFRHRAAALQEVRRAIEELRPDAGYAHRLMDFNNSPQTSLSDVHAVLRRAMEALGGTGGEQAMDVTVVLTVEGDVAAPGRPVTLSVVTTNVGSETATFGEGSSGCWAGALIEIDGAQEDISGFRMCTMDYVLRSLEPGDSRPEQWEWEGQVLRDGKPAPLPAGTYSVTPVCGTWRGSPVEVRVGS